MWQSRFLPSNFAADEHANKRRDAIWLYEAATGKSHVAVRFLGPFQITFRASWVDDGKALVINRNQTISHIVLFDRFWVKESAP